MNTKLLRQKILDLAIRGKLTEQKKSDGTTKDLLAQIQDERRETKDERDAGKKDSSNVIASEAKQSKKSKPAEPKTIIPLNKDEAPFEIPENWEWVRLGDLCSSVSSGKTPSTIQKELWNGNVLWVTSKDVKQKYIYSTQICLSELGAQTMRLYPENTMIIVGRSGILRHTLPVTILKQKATINQDLKALVFLDNKLAEYIYAAIKGMEQDLLHRYKKAGTTVDNLNFDEFITAGIPLPPLAEQKRIVEAIENAFAEITEIENNQELLKKHIKQGRQKILDLAIRGRLTQQLKTDGTTKDLLAQISKQWLVSSKQDSQKENVSFNVIANTTSTSSRTPIRDPFAASKNSDDVIASTAKQSKKKTFAPKQIIPLDKSEAPFEIPSTWEWVKLGDVCDKLIDGDHNPPKGISKQTEYLMLSSRNVNDNKVVDLENVRYLTKEMFEEENKRTNLIEGDILFTSVGSLGRSCVYDGNGNFCFQRSVTIVHTLIFNKYLKYFFDSDYYQKVIVENATGTAQLGFYLEQMRKSLVALPPLAEQQRIVATIESAFTEFDAMEKGIL